MDTSENSPYDNDIVGEMSEYLNAVAERSVKAAIGELNRNLCFDAKKRYKLRVTIREYKIELLQQDTEKVFAAHEVKLDCLVQIEPTPPEHLGETSRRAL